MEPVLTKGFFKVVIDDPSLKGFNDLIKQRYERYILKKREIEKVEGSLSNFALGFKSFGIHATATGIIYREWAPGADGLYLVTYI
jgi:1,4-alpha-glucan branching enzyme